jgi:hypothetical protein
MLSYELNHWRAEIVVKLQQTAQRIGEQVFLSELTQNSYFLCNWSGVSCGIDKAPWC